ncbi:hypothetical protein [Streptomyces sp. NPDC127084]|uniref:hypothetical protein n=1 Tax=Streptomyces sp. NPDC127084 TaxID=3347133 RepID=UPI003654D594
MDYGNIGVSYEKNSGSAITAKFGRSYNGGPIVYAGLFNQSAGTTKSTSWKDSYYYPACYSAVGYMSVVGQTTFNTPPATGC